MKCIFTRSLLVLLIETILSLYVLQMRFGQYTAKRLGGKELSEKLMLIRYLCAWFIILKNRNLLLSLSKKRIFLLRTNNDVYICKSRYLLQLKFCLYSYSDDIIEHGNCKKNGMNLVSFPCNYTN